VSRARRRRAVLTLNRFVYHRGARHDIPAYLRAYRRARRDLTGRGTHTARRPPWTPARSITGTPGADAFQP
jgi:hypothetical protein